MKPLMITLALCTSAVSAEPKTEVMVYPCERVAANLCALSEAAAKQSVNENFGTNYDGYMITKAVAFRSTVEFIVNPLSGADLEAASLIAKAQACSTIERRNLIQAGGDVRYHIPEDDTGQIVGVRVTSCEVP